MNPSLLSAEGLTECIFLVFIGVTIIGAIIATTSKRLMRAIAGLGLCFLGVAGIYYFLNSPFVALMQILIYVGAICVTFVFAVMLAAPEGKDSVPKNSTLAGPASLIVSGVLAWGLAAFAFKTHWQVIAPPVNNGSIAEIGKSLLTTYSMSFELISVVLLVAIIGSLVLGRTGRSNP